MVADKIVHGWDDPRMPTIAAFRRRGYTARALRNIITTLGVTKNESVIDIGRLEEAVRNDLNENVQRRMAVLDPIKVVITNYPAGQVEQVELDNHPKKPEAGKRSVPFSRELYIDRDDFMEDPPKDFFRLGPGREVRLRGAYFIKCENFVKGADGKVVEVQCTYDPASRGGESPDGRKVKGTMHWVSAAHALTAEARIYERLFAVAAPGEGHPDTESMPAFAHDLNPNSLRVANNVKLEPSLASSKIGETFQFERLGYFNVDLDSKTEALVFNRTILASGIEGEEGGRGEACRGSASETRSEGREGSVGSGGPRGGDRVR
ncbi:MAG: glutamate--tRNA ligase family protein [Archangium sp.]